MRTTLTFVGCLVAMAIVADCALGHGGNYTGPSGGGTPGFSGPVGGATTGPNPGNPNPGGTTPGSSPGGTTGPTGGGSTGPLRPGGAPSTGGAVGGGRGGVTPGMGKAKGTSDRTLDWDWWWDLNDDRFLNLKNAVRSQKAASTNTDTFLDEIGGDNIAKVTTTQIRRQILPSLLLGLKDPYYDARAGAVIALGKIGDGTQPEVLQSITKLLADTDNRVRESSCLALGLLGNKSAVPDLLEVAQNTPKGRKLCGQGTGDVDTRVRSFAAVAIGLIGNREAFTTDDKVIPKLIEMVQTKSANVDVQVGSALALQLIKSPEGIPAMINIYKNPEQDKWVRAHLGVALGKIGAKAAIPELLKGLKDKETFVSHSAAIALGLLVTREETDVVRELIRNANSASDRGTKNFCIIALGEIGHPEGKAALLRMITKGQTADQTFAALALGLMGNKFSNEASEAGEVMFAQYKQEKGEDQKAALAIGLALLEYTPAAPVLLDDLSSGKGKQSLKGHLCTALGLLNHSEAIPAIQEHVKQKGDQDLRKSAAIALGLLRDRDAVELLKKVIDDSSNSKAILGAATVALGFVGDRSAVPTLVAMVENKNSTYMDVSRAFATVALGFLGDKDDIPFLSKIHENSNYLAQSGALAELLTIL